MRNDGQRTQGGVPRTGGAGGRNNNNNSNGLIPTSFRAISSYLKIVSSGASSVASTVKSAASAASAIVDRDNDVTRDQVHWAGFDKLECEQGITRQVLLLGYQYGFQVWDVEDADDIHELVSRHDGFVSFAQLLPKPIPSKQYGDKFEKSRPLLVICADGSFSGGNVREVLATPCDCTIQNCHGPLNGGCMPTVIWFYSLRSQSYVHVLKFRSVVYLVRCSSRVVAVLQAAQIHCFDATTLERQYTILTNPVVTGSSGSGGIGFGPLAVGPRWMAYSGSPVAASNSGRVCPKHLTPSASFSSPASNGSLVAHLATGIVTLGDMGYKKLSKYYSELSPDGNSSMQSGSPRSKVHGVASGQLHDADNVGMVIIRDIVSKSVVSQFRAHKCPISSLCFDPSGTLLVTASVQGHNINVFRIMPGSSSGSNAGASYVHLYRLQRGLTNAVIQDISFSNDSHWVMISSSKGTNHLFAISPSGGVVNFQFPDASYVVKNNGSSVMGRPAVNWPQNSGLLMLNQQSLCASGPPITLSVVSRIRSGNNGWRSTVTGAAVAATGRSSLNGAIASAFHDCKGHDFYAATNLLKANHHLLVFSPSGSLIQYTLHIPSGIDAVVPVLGLNTGYESTPDCDARLVVEAIQKWNICQKQNRRDREDNVDIYGENGNLDSSRVYPEGIKKENTLHFGSKGAVIKEKVSYEERHHGYLSEAELHMHQARIPLWEKPELYFGCFILDRVKIDDGDALGGEIEIERIPLRMIEARSKDLVPVFDYLQASRGPALDSNCNGGLLHHRPGFSGSDRFTSRSSSGSLDSMTDGVTMVAKLYSGTEEAGWNGLQMPTETTKGFVNNHDSPQPNRRFETVNSRDSSMREAQFKSVNNSIEGLKMENQFGDEVDEFE